MGTPAVRQATVIDLPAMLSVWRESDEEAGFQRQAELIRALDKNPTLLLVAESRGQVVGVALGTTDGHWGYPKRLVVLPAHRRRGVGRALVTELERRFAGLGVDRLNVTIRRGNAASMALSSSLGYEREEHVTVWVKTLSARPA